MTDYLRNINQLINDLRRRFNSDNFITIEKSYWYEDFISLFPIIMDLDKTNLEDKKVLDNFYSLLVLVIDKYNFRKNQEKRFIPTQFIEENL